MTVQQATLESAALAVFAAAKKILGDEAIPSKAVIVGGAALWRLTQHRPTAVSLTLPSSQTVLLIMDHPRRRILISG